MVSYERIYSIEHLISCLDKGYSDFCICNGLLRSSKTIEKKDDKFWILNEIDDSEEMLTLDELKESHIAKAIENNCFYLFLVI